jgi:hypothetical protein
MKIQDALRHTALVPNGLVLQRAAELQTCLASGWLPAGLLQKLSALPVRQGLRNSALAALVALRRQRSVGPRLPEPFATLALYRLAYLWEEDDDIADTCAGGLADDALVVTQLIAQAKRHLDDWVLLSNRLRVQQRWKDGQEAGKRL